jgi:uncharacterized protein (DUF1330 family)
MAAYVIVDVEVMDPVEYRNYTKQVPATLAAYGGRFIVRGGRVERLEGDWDPGRIVVIEFDSLERAKAWWSSEEYAEPKKMRQSASTAGMIVVEGV